MAPELLSAQFGAVGPASDLYSLGFTAYELMVGSQFESLLPTLATFGRNKQLAWMMWHSTADVKLPDIARVLQGVPEDLARVIQRLIAKDQSQRYRSAHEALRDLQASRAVVEGLPDAADPEAEAEAAAAARRKKRFKQVAALFSGIAVILFVLIAWKLASKPPKERIARRPDTFTGTISDVFAASGELGVAPSDGGAVKRIIVKDQDIISVDGEQHLIQGLAPGDVVEIITTVDPRSHKVVQEIHATRPGKSAGGILLRDDGARTIVIDTGETNHQELKIFVPADLRKIYLNGEQTFQEKPVTLASLRPGDRLRVWYDCKDTSGNVARRPGRGLRRTNAERDQGESPGDQAAVRAAVIRDHGQRASGSGAVEPEAR
jgi:hypothetical protein